MKKPKEPEQQSPAYQVAFVRISDPDFQMGRDIFTMLDGFKGTESECKKRVSENNGIPVENVLLCEVF